MARLGDGWLASAYNTTPEGFVDARARLGRFLEDAGRDPEALPSALASMFFYVTGDRARVQDAVSAIATALNRPAEEARERLLIGSAAECVEKLSGFASAGVERILMWPIGDDLAQLDVFAKEIATELRSSAETPGGAS